MPPTKPLNEQERSRVEQIAAQFAAAWKGYEPGGDDVFLSAFLPSTEDRLHVLLLHQLIPTDLAFRWRRGEQPLLEQYLESFPELGKADDLPAELIHAEFRIRSRHGDAPSLDSYAKRFPKQFVSFKAMFSQTANAETARSLYDTPSSSREPAPQPVAPSRPKPKAVAPPPADLRSSGSRKVLPIGEGYQLVKCIGSGQFGDVWNAEAPGGVEVAVKVIRWTANNKLTQVELRALELIKRLRHAFLLQVQAYWLAEGQLFIVMDLADRNLSERLEECRAAGMPGIPVDELLSYMREVGEALDYLHSNQVLHRDIKPANIMLAGGHAKLTDFGLARLMIEKGSDIHATTTGTPLYMSPEVWGNKVGPESDQYSLASTYVELRLGRPMFAAQTYADVMLDHLNTRPDLKPLPAREQQALHKALAKQTEKRYASCKEFVEALQKAVHEDQHPPDKAPTRRRALMALVVGGTVTAAGWAGWQFGLFGGLEMSVPGKVEVVTGEELEFEIHLRGASGTNTTAPKFANVPEGLKLTTISTTPPAVSGDPLVWRIRVTSDVNLSEDKHGKAFEVGVSAADGEREIDRTLDLTILPPVMTIPPGCDPATGAKRVRVAAEKRSYWDRIVRRLPNGATLMNNKPCELVLIPYDPSSGATLPSFYMMENKVWNELFAAFYDQHLQAHPGLRPQPKTPVEPKPGEAKEIVSKDWSDDWRVYGAARDVEEKAQQDMPADDHKLHPVMNVSFAAAKAFALWMGGKLPSEKQWDTAAGFYLPDARQRLGPFKGTWSDDPATRADVAVNRAKEGTAVVGAAKDDVSPYSIRDMSGNGYEWTRDETGGPFSSVILRGRPYDVDKPLFYDHLREEENQVDMVGVANAIGNEEPAQIRSNIGFRIVIEPLVASAPP